MTDQQAGRVMKATFNGRTYSIPEMWVAGFCSSNLDGRPRATIMEAVAWWAWQQELAERERQRSLGVISLGLVGDHGPRP